MRNIMPSPNEKSVTSQIVKVVGAFAVSKLIAYAMGRKGPSGPVCNFSQDTASTAGHTLSSSDDPVAKKLAAAILGSLPKKGGPTE
jgi:hypothetical protein